MSSKTAPPGWQPHQIVTRIDGYIADRGGRVPAAVAAMIARNVPSLDNTVAAIRKRMRARHKKVFGNV